MDEKIVAVFCLCDDLLKALHHHEDAQSEMSDAEVMTTAIAAALFFGANYERARELLYEQGYMPKMLSKSRFNRRLHRIGTLFVTLFNVLGDTFKALNGESVYAIDTFPIAVCDNIRIPRSQIYQGEDYRGYKPSKKRYFYGLKIHMMVTQTGEPVEFFLTPGAYSDTAGLELFDFDLPEDAQVFADKAYNDYEIEDVLNDCAIHLIPIRKRNSKRPLPPWMHYLQAVHRKIIETTGSLIERLLPKSIHAVTPQGFELKVVLFCLACSVNCLDISA
jgi:hypothetical protein